jgi:hypothetical protein
MPVDFCAHSGPGCTTLDIVTPLVWGQYMRPRDEENHCKDVVGRYLTACDGDLVPEDFSMDPDEFSTSCSIEKLPEQQNI